jgi:hypothetical protein
MDLRYTKLSYITFCRWQSAQKGLPKCINNCNGWKNCNVITVNQNNRKKEICKNGNEIKVKIMNDKYDTFIFLIISDFKGYSLLQKY